MPPPVPVRLTQSESCLMQQRSPKICATSLISTQRFGPQVHLTNLSPRLTGASL
jgi:hypothetical protein